MLVANILALVFLLAFVNFTKRECLHWM